MKRLAVGKGALADSRYRATVDFRRNENAASVWIAEPKYCNSAVCVRSPIEIARRVGRRFEGETILSRGFFDAGIENAGDYETCVGETSSVKFRVKVRRENDFCQQIALAKSVVGDVGDAVRNCVNAVTRDGTTY